MLKHCVFLNFKSEHSAEERLRVMRDLGEVARKIPGVLDYSFGPNVDFEAKTPNHRDGFIVTFEDRAANLAYDAHPDHKALGAKLVSMCEGGHAGILVYDIEVSPH